MNDTTVTAGAVLAAVALWYASLRVTDSRPLQLAVLIGVGVVAPLTARALRGE